MLYLRNRRSSQYCAFLGSGTVRRSHIRFLRSPSQENSESRDVKSDAQFVHVNPVWEEWWWFKCCFVSLIVKLSNSQSTGDKGPSDTTESLKQSSTTVFVLPNGVFGSDRCCDSSVIVFNPSTKICLNLIRIYRSCSRKSRTDTRRWQWSWIKTLRIFPQIRSMWGPPLHCDCMTNFRRVY